MRKLFFFGAALLFVLMAFSCATAKPTEHIHRQWMLIEFRDFSKADLMKNKAALDLQLLPGNGRKYSAYMGCNNLFLSANFDGNGKVRFSDVGNTLMYCESGMELEAAFANDLPQMVNYSVAGHYLTLTDARGNKMKFIAADWD